jgi:undecaprenyl diphosphate synthase
LQENTFLTLESVKASGEIPKHVSIIMDGNGRWAGARFRPRVFGHHKGALAVRRTVEAARQLEVKYLTLYAFSDENWGRPAYEVSAVMELLERYIAREIDNLNRNGIRLHAIGELSKLPATTKKVLDAAIAQLSGNSEMTLTLCLSYGGRTEISEALKKIVHKAEAGEITASKVNAELISEHLWTAGMPDPDLMIRTSGEQRLSNFLLWQHAYSEMFFSKVSWPDFSMLHFLEAIHSFQGRQRRFGRINEPSRPLSSEEIEELKREEN